MQAQHTKRLVLITNLISRVRARAGCECEHVCEEESAVCLPCHQPPPPSTPPPNTHTRTLHTHTKQVKDDPDGSFTHRPLPPTPHPTHPPTQVRHPFTAQHERERKQGLELLMQRTREQVRPCACVRACSCVRARSCV